VRLSIHVPRLIMIATAMLFGACADPAEDFIRRTDAMPPDQRPPHWEETRRLMLRPAPRVGEPAPDFTLVTVDGSQRITRSKFHPDRPLMLIFGSFT
jgi:hypothetical protein